MIAQGSQLSLSGAEVISATIEIEDVHAHRAKNNMQPASIWCYNHQDAVARKEYQGTQPTRGAKGV